MGPEKTVDHLFMPREEDRKACSTNMHQNCFEVRRHGFYGEEVNSIFAL
jgi:hypothetical protein